MVSVLEGSQAIQDELTEAINEWSIISVRMLGEELINTTGVDFGAIIEEWMRRQSVAVSAEDEDEPVDTGEIDVTDVAEHVSVGANATITELPRAVGGGGKSAS